MANLIVSDNKIKVRRYNLEIDGKIVEEMLSSKMANILADEYRAEGFAVNKIETFSVTNGINIVGEDMVTPRSDPKARQIGTPEATDLKVKKDRTAAHNRAALMEAKNNKPSTSVRYTEYGRDRNSSLHSMYLDNLRKNGYRVFNTLNGEVRIGFQKEIAEYIFHYLKNGGKKSDLNIKFLGA